MPQASAQESPARRTSPAQWLIVVLLAVIATCLLIEVGFSTSRAYAQVGSGVKGNIFAVAGQLSRETYGVFLVDAENGTICIYEWVPDKIAGRKLRLMAARNFSFDMQLDDYNTEPLPREIRILVEQHPRLNDATTQP